MWKLIYRDTKNTVSKKLKLENLIRPSVYYKLEISIH